MATALAAVLMPRFGLLDLRVAVSPPVAAPITVEPLVRGGRDATGHMTTTELTPTEQLESLVRDHLDAVYRVAFSVVRDSALAEDVSQDAILKAWNALPTFRGESSLRSWVLRITHNTAISTLRKRREEIRDPDMLPETVSSSSTERDVVGSMSIDAFEQALNQLDELSRSIVVLREVEGMTYEEVAETLEVPLPTVKTRLLRARRVLAAALEDWRP
ncbi:MAG: RNA polymerase sigma factor [Acidimicrobiales bacterium]|nr:RNA polymerase sigma factor [Acidimicrobiales bacterium]RZV47189.1 MAG: RNA polymerase sigma factor [Acidimicrobiales bacterium]